MMLVPGGAGRRLEIVEVEGERMGNVQELEELE
jgi:hypothetical protein